MSRTGPHRQTLPRSNPFATRYVRPGAIPFEFPDHRSPRGLVDRLAALQWRARIVGPHGSGKTTLLECLLPECAQRDREVELFSLHDGQRCLPPHDPSKWHNRTLVVVDGYEQLRWWSRKKLQWSCQRHNCGLLITTHGSGPLPVLYETGPTLALVQKLVTGLLHGADERIKPVDIQAAYDQHGPNVREVLFALYDLYQSRA